MIKKQPSLKNLISAKIATADISGAIRILTSDDTLLTQSADTIQSLQEKHPPAHPDSKRPTAPVYDVCITTNKENLLKALYSFKRGAAGGPDRFLPQHLRDMCDKALGEPATKTCGCPCKFYEFDSLSRRSAKRGG